MSHNRNTLKLVIVLAILAVITVGCTSGDTLVDYRFGYSHATEEKLYHVDEKRTLVLEWSVKAEAGSVSIWFGSDAIDATIFEADGINMSGRRTVTLDPGDYRFIIKTREARNGRVIVTAK